MKQLKQWILWESKMRPGQAKPTKVPVSPAGHNIDPLNPVNWMSHAEAAQHGKPLGFVFTAEDPYFFLDLDGCLQDGAWTPRAVSLLNRFPRAMREVSVSGKGLHVFGTYTGARPEHGTRCGEIGGELYTANRFVALGSSQQGDANADCTTALRDLVAQHFPPVATVAPVDWSSGPREGWTGPTDDDALISKASRATSPFSKTASFEQLWNCDAEALGVAYPDAERVFDASAADLALARHLAFWTGCDCERIERLMRRSGLARDKWHREDYLQGTIGRAVASCDRVYDYEPPPPTPTPVAEVREAPPEQIRTGFQFLTVQEQVEFFKGCVYVISRNSVMLPTGEILKQAQFNAVMPCYEFARDSEGKATPTKKPWDAYTESFAFQPTIADEACFDPASGWDEVIRRGGFRYANTYRPIDTPRKKGDPGRFLAHLAKLLPDEHDQQIMLAYMAAVVQHKGVKFQWCPLIQGVEGNGKSLLSYVLMEAIGSRYSHNVQAQDISNKFNSWLQGNILVFIEDIYVPNENRAVVETLKPMITNGVGAGIQRKGVDQETAQICCNFMINSNHKDALPKTRNDRRFAVFFTAQQQFSDLARDGMHAGSGYFPPLYKWLRDEGFAIVHDFLATYEIPDELNPATECMRAPETSSTEQAIQQSVGAREQELEEMIAIGRAGFCAPWVSRMMWHDVLKADHAKMSIRAQRVALEGMGYVPHPALDLRTNNNVEPDGRRAELWVKKDHPAACMNDPLMVAKWYEATQRGETWKRSNEESKERPA